MTKELKHVTVFRERHLKPNEEIRAWVDGYIGEMMGSGKDTQHNGALIVTDQRVAFYRKGLLGDVFQAIPLGKISSVEQRSSGVNILTLHTSHDDLTFKTFMKRELDAAMAAIERGRDASSGSQGTGSSTGDPVTLLQKLQGASLVWHFVRLRV